MDVDDPELNVSEEYVRPVSYNNVYRLATEIFQHLFLENKFGYACDVCDRLWHKGDLYGVSDIQINVLIKEFPIERSQIESFEVCKTCKQSLSKGKVPYLSTSNGYKYPDRRLDLPPLDPIAERLISPRLPFMQIRRLYQDTGTYKILGQVINIPVEVDNMVKMLPRQLDDDYAINLNIKKHILHKSTYLSGKVKKRVVKEWLRYMITTPLYKRFNIQYKEEDTFKEVEDLTTDNTDDSIEYITEENDKNFLVGQQHTILWNEDKYLDIAPGQNKQPLSIIFDDYAEELSFPSIYYGQPRIFKQGIKATSFSMATSEIRRKDRRGVTPQHILYMAVKILRLRVCSGLHSTFRVHANVKNITREKLEDKSFIHECVENNLAFLKSIPNSMEYWNSRKKDLFAMIGQLGKPTMFLTMSANEIR